MAQKTTLAEIMGSTAASAGQNLTLEHLPGILGEAMPHLPKNPLGRHRLIRALKQRFGNNFRSLPGISGIISQFDNEITYQGRLDQMRAVKAGGKRG